MKGNLTRFKLTSTDAERGELVLLDSLFDVKTFAYNYKYEIPRLSKETMTVKLNFEFIDEKGNSKIKECKINAIKSIVLQPELKDIILYSGLSIDNPNAFLLTDPSKPFNYTSVTAETIDVFDFVPVLAEGKVHGDTLSREWQSKTSVLFVKDNSLNYALATEYIIQKGFEKGTKVGSVKDIRVDDIIILGKADKAQGVVRITEVTDSEGVENDSYKFNYKGKVIK